MLKMFYESVVVRAPLDVVGEELDPLTTVSEKEMLSREHSILDNFSHPLQNMLVSPNSA